MNGWLATTPPSPPTSEPGRQPHNNIGSLRWGNGPSDDALSRTAGRSRSASRWCDYPTVAGYQSTLALSHNNIGITLMPLAVPTMP